MKKLFFFAAAALTLAACTSEELNVQTTNKVEDNAAVNFDVYVNRGVTRAGTPNDINNSNIGKIGFGVFGYYTNDTQYSSSATPNFMYNQKVTTTDATATTSSVWTYEPVKYWPNEYGDAAISDEIDYVSFFAYAPWTAVAPTTGKPLTNSSLAESVQHQENYNIVGVNKNNATGDPIIKYVVDTDPATSVDLLWGVKASGSTETSIAGTQLVPSPEVGMPFIDLTKPADPVDGKIRFNLKHALAKVKVTIDYIDDAQTPAGPAAKKLNANETRIYVRWLEINGFAMKGALNLNNEEPNTPNWKDYDSNGQNELVFPVTTRFNDGRKDAKEGTQNGQANNELNICLNDSIIENFASTEKKDGKIIFGAKKNCGVTAEPQLVFGGDSTVNGGYFYVIPRNQGETVDIKINYDVLTLDSLLTTNLSGTKDAGSEIENQIEKLDIFEGADFEPGKVYNIKIHLGMTSVKFEATVEPWNEITNEAEVDLPDNQPDADNSGSAAGISADALNNVSLNNGGVINAVAATDTDPLTVNYTVPAAGGKEAIEGDFAKIFAELKAQGVTEITLNNKTYTWSDTYNAFVNGAQNAKIEAMLAGSFANAPTYSVTMTSNKGDIKFVKA